MKHLLFWKIAAIGVLLVSDAGAQVIKYPAYISYYNSTTKIPDSVIWIASPHAKVAKRSAGFHETGGRQNIERDYLHSGYDIGHNADASDMNGNTTDEYNSFDFVNTYPQRPNCNRLTWLALENYTRSLNCPVRVKVSYVGTNGSIGIDKVTVPLYCVKELWYQGKYEKYVMPNLDTVNRHVFGFYRLK